MLMSCKKVKRERQLEVLGKGIKELFGRAPKDLVEDVLAA